MSQSLQDGVLAQFGERGLRQIAVLPGADAPSATEAVTASLGTLVGGVGDMAHNTADPEGASAPRRVLTGRLDRALGGRGTVAAAQKIPQAHGSRSGDMPRVPMAPAPLVMSTLVRRAAERDTDAGTIARDLGRQPPVAGAAPRRRAGEGALRGPSPEAERPPDAVSASTPAR
ncbi:hypothetical protein SAMN05421505_103166 [Sinosporangium album]|uniref:Uncharacterized protein n=1 Tax=Sinosporangium album TaxID=504805 RepID=A0A1G7T9R2_9ACTN|nr:DUF937 domain-containing protein [Sinosporangium album]SDG31822.1 hypothetical protein SAMN05421505_103166 [Sinosporangium album]